MNKSSFALKFLLALALSISFTASKSQAEDLKTLLSKVEKYSAEENYTKALDELAWAKKEIEKKYMTKLSKFLPDTLLNYTGEKVSNSSALGMSQVSRSYKDGSDSFKIEIVSGTSGSGANQFGGLAALGQMAALMGQNTGQSTFRIKGKTASLDENEKEMTIFLDGGRMLKISRKRGNLDLKEIAEALDIEGMETFLKG